MIKDISRKLINKKHHEKKDNRIKMLIRQCQVLDMVCTDEVVLNQKVNPKWVEG